MGRPIEAIIWWQVAAGVLVGFLAVALVRFELYQPTPVVAATVALLALVVAARGLKPFGETIAYRVAQAAAFALWGSAVIITEEISVLSLVFVVLGAGGTAYYVREANRRGLLEPVSESSVDRAAERYP